MKKLFKSIIKELFRKLLNENQKLRLHTHLGAQLPKAPSKGESMFNSMNNLKKLGYSPDVIIDIGAYQGTWTLEARKIFTSSTFLMLEAQRSKEQLLQGIANKHENVIYKIGLVGKEYNRSITFYELETGSSMYYEQTHFDRQVAQYEMHSLDSIVRECNLDGEFFIKLDVQGAEIDILEGAKGTLDKTNFILLEASLLNYNLGAPLIAEVIDYLNQKGFVLFDICDQLRQGDGALFQVDLIFSRKNTHIRNKINFDSKSKIKVANRQESHQ